MIPTSHPLAFAAAAFVNIVIPAAMVGGVGGVMIIGVGASVVVTGSHG